MANRVAAPHRTSEAVRISFPTLFVPKAFQADQTPKYSIVIMLNKQNPAHMAYLKQIYEDVNYCLVTQWPDEATRPRTEVIGDYPALIQDADIHKNKQQWVLKDKNEEYAGHYIMRANGTQRPTTVIEVAPGQPLQEILEPTQVYGGCWGKVNINAYAFMHPQNNGVALGLNGFCKVADDESFGTGRPSSEDMFGAANGAAPAGQPITTPPPAGPPVNTGFPPAGAPPAGPPAGTGFPPAGPPAGTAVPPVDPNAGQQPAPFTPDPAASPGGSFPPAVPGSTGFPPAGGGGFPPVSQ